MGRWREAGLAGSLVMAAALVAAAESPATPAATAEQAFEILKGRCVRCHGPARKEGGLDLSTPAAIRRGGRSGAAIRGEVARSLLWTRVASGQMPPEEPLPAGEKATLRTWLAQGAPGVPARVPAQPSGDEHWASQKLRPVTPPAVRSAARVRGAIDRFIQARLEAVGLTLSAEAPRAVLIRRVALDLTGLPPTPAEIEAFLNDRSPRAYEAMVERYLTSPKYGERWGKHWLDAAGYADSNGYFSADTDRPLAYRYRDYVVRSVNADKPWDRFLQEQLAGDELVGYGPGMPVRPEMVEALEATHFLRNSQDGTDSSDGNPDERRADKYAVLEGTQQIIGSALLGVTVQCARCHDHKFEPFTQREYYGLQAVIYPAFNVEKWVPPAQRQVDAATPEEMAVWQSAVRKVDEQITARRREWEAWARQNRQKGKVLFQAAFDGAGEKLAQAWSNTAPGDTQPSGTPAVNVDSPAAPGAQIVDGRLHIRESGSAGDRALSTRQSFDWTPEARGAWIQATFDLVGGGPTAPYVGYFVALRDFAGASGTGAGNVLLDGNAAGQAAVHVGYPARSTGKGKIGRSGYTPGRSYGVRITNVGGDRFELSQWVDGVPEEGTVTLARQDLPDGGFGFEYCCGRSFVVDNVRIEAGEAGDPQAAEAFRKKRAEAEAEIKSLEAKKPARPGRLAPVTDLSAEPPRVPLLERGEYKNPREPVAPVAPAALSEPANPAALRPPAGLKTTGRRLALAKWLTQPGSRAAARLARVTVNRWWLHHFGSGLVSTPDNLGYSGANPTHPELLEYLAGRLVNGGWSARALHREILHSATYRQVSVPTPAAKRVDEPNRLLSHFPLHRLDAEAVRDGMLAVSGELDPALGGPYVPTTRNGEGEVIAAEGQPGSRRRSLYLQQRRTQVTGLLSLFDAPSIVFNCTARTPTTVPLQSLALLNSEFVRARAAGLARRLRREVGEETRSRLRLAFLLTTGEAPEAGQTAAAERFLQEQVAEYGSGAAAEERAWTDFCQSLLASNAFLYVK